MQTAKRVAVVGTGQFGRNHCRVIRESGRAELAAVMDSDAARASEAAAAFGSRAVNDLEALAGLADAAVVAVPTTRSNIAQRLVGATSTHFVRSVPVTGCVAAALVCGDTHSKMRCTLGVATMTR